MCNQCPCAHQPDHGACDHFEAGSNGRCVYCDHAAGCHPGTGEWHNGPLEAVRRYVKAVEGQAGLRLDRAQIETGRYVVRWAGMDVTGYCHEADSGKDNYVKLYRLTRRGQIRPAHWYVRRGEVEIEEVSDGEAQAAR